jgi:hypothetical protein
MVKKVKPNSWVFLYSPQVGGIDGTVYGSYLNMKGIYPRLKTSHAPPYTEATLLL